MTSLADATSLLLRRYPEDEEVAELDRRCKDICACARDALGALDTAAHEESVYLSNAASAMMDGDLDGLSDEEIRETAEAVASFGEIADLAAREAETISRDLAKKALSSGDS